MLKISLTQSAKNLPLNMAKDAKIGSKISFKTRLAKNLSLSIDIAENAEVGKMVIAVRRKQSKNHLFAKNHIYL